MATIITSQRATHARALIALTVVLLLAALAVPAAAAPPAAPAAIGSTTPVLAASTTISDATREARRRNRRRRRKVVRFAHEQLGKPYRWGGSGPNAYDCSGLTMAAWATVGKNLPHSSRMQAGVTRRVRWRDKKLGDLFFYGSPIHHVAIYVGDGKMIEAPRSGLQVRKVSARRRGRVKIGRVRLRS